MAWKKCTIQDAIDRWSFSDQYGLSYFSVKSVELKIGENWKDLLDVYKKIDNDYIKLDYKIDKNFFDFNKIFQKLMVKSLIRCLSTALHKS